MSVIYEKQKEKRQNKEVKQIRQLINSRTETEYLIKNLCVEVCTCECRCQERPEVSAASLGAGDGVSREPPHGGAGN